MPISQVFVVSDSSTTANFNAWGSAVNAALTAFGWTKTADTGQVSWGSSPAFPASGASVYEIWQPGDALQTGSTKFFLRIDYANISGAGMGLIFQIGTGTNGAGTMTGFVSNKVSSGGFSGSAAGNLGATAFECDFSGDTDRFGMIMWRNASNQRAVVFAAIERTKDTSGNDNSDGVTLFVYTSGIFGTGSVVGGTGSTFDGGPVQQTITFVNGVGNLIAPQWSRGFCWIETGMNQSDQFANSVAVSPVFPDYGKFGNPATVVVGARTQDITEGGMFTTTLYGATRTYLATNNFHNGVGVQNNGSGSGFMRLAMRYD